MLFTVAKTIEYCGLSVWSTVEVSLQKMVINARCHQGGTAQTIWMYPGNHISNNYVVTCIIIIICFKIEV